MSNNIEEIDWPSFLVKLATAPKILDAETYMMVQESAVTTGVRVSSDLWKVY